MGVLGGVSGAIVKTGMAPIERVKLLLQTQDSNPKIISGEEPRYTGIGDCFRRVQSEQGMKAFWRGNLVNCLRYAPQQGSALAFNDAIKRMMPKYSPKTDYYKDSVSSSSLVALLAALRTSCAIPSTSRVRALPRTSVAARR